VGDIDGWTHHTMTSSALQDLAAVCALCNEAELEYKDGVYGRIGEPTEAALKVLVEKMGVSGLVKQADPHSMVRQCNAHWKSAYEKLAILEFNRDRKSMSVLCRSIESESNVLFVKGAAEVLVERCSRIKLTDGSIVPITPDVREQLRRKVAEMARQPLRTLAMAYRCA
jgi:magnesium-transporting ATPase (P-type)